VAKADKDIGKVSVYEEVDVRTYLLTDLEISTGSSQW